MIPYLTPCFERNPEMIKTLFCYSFTGKCRKSGWEIFDAENTLYGFYIIL